MAAPWAYRGLEKRLAVPQSSLTPVRPISSLMTLTTSSRLAWLSLRVAPSGATSRSWKAKNWTPSFSKNSNATFTRVRALARPSAPSSQGRIAVPTPNGSDNGLAIVCQ